MIPTLRSGPRLVFCFQIRLRRVLETSIERKTMAGRVMMKPRRTAIRPAAAGCRNRSSFFGLLSFVYRTDDLIGL